MDHHESIRLLAANWPELNTVPGWSIIFEPKFGLVAVSEANHCLAMLVSARNLFYEQLPKIYAPQPETSQPTASCGKRIEEKSPASS